MTLRTRRHWKWAMCEPGTARKERERRCAKKEAGHSPRQRRGFALPKIVQREEEMSVTPLQISGKRRAIPE